MVTAFLFRHGSGFRASFPRALPPELVSLAGLDAPEAARHVERLRRHEMVFSARAILLPWWRREVRLEGLEHLRLALAPGGAILWVPQCVSSDIAVKQALFEAGYPLTQLSRPSHPFSRAPFSVRFVNPILRRGEDRFLAERVFMQPAL
jgi:hypothetical protein